MPGPDHGRRAGHPGRSPWSVSSFTLAEIKRLDAGAWSGAKLTGERVPTLREWVLGLG